MDVKDTNSTEDVKGHATKTVQDKACCINLTLRKFGTKRKADISQVETEADKDMLYLTKDILDSAELQAIEKLYGNTKSYLKKKALPAKTLKSGLYLVPLGLVEVIEKNLQEFKEQEKGLVEKFLSAYPAQVEEAEQRLKNQYNSSDYPSIEKLRQSFNIEYNFLSIDVNESLKSINKEIWKREKEKIEQQWQQTLNEVDEGIKQGMAILMDHLIDRLGMDESGNRKTFKNATVTNLTEFLDAFDVKNINDDQDLKNIVGRAKSILQGVKPDDLRKDVSVRDTVLAGFSKIRQELAAENIISTSRIYSFEEDP